MAALIYLQTRLIRNGILSVLGNPRRLIFALLFTAWIGTSVFVGVVSKLTGGSIAARLFVVPPDVMRIGILGGLLLLTLTAIERGLSGSVFSFAAADYDFLFPTPVKRRLVVASRVAVDSLTVVAWVGIFAVSMVAALPIQLLGPDASPTRLVLVWVAGFLYALFMVNLARVVELLVTGSQALLGMNTAVLRAIVWVLAFAVAGTLVFAIVLSGGGVPLADLSDRLTSPPWSIILLPLLSVASFVTGDPAPIAGSAAATLGFLAVLAASCILAVVRLDRDVVEATIEHSARVSRMRKAAREQDAERMMGESLRVRSRGRSLRVSWRRSDLALIYKGLAESAHGSPLRWVGIAALVLAPAFLARLAPGDEIARYAPGPVVTYLLLLFAGVQAMRFRSELNHITLLRTLPVPGRRQVLALVIPRALWLSAVLGAGIASFWLGRPIQNASLSFAVAISLPFTVTIAYLMGAISACLFPAGGDPSQRFFSGLLLMVGTAAALAPTIALLVFGLLLRQSGPGLALMGIASALPMAFLLALAAGALFDRFEPGDE